MMLIFPKEQVDCDLPIILLLTVVVDLDVRSPGCFPADFYMEVRKLHFIGLRFSVLVTSFCMVKMLNVVLYRDS